MQYLGTLQILIFARKTENLSQYPRQQYPSTENMTIRLNSILVDILQFVVTNATEFFSPKEEYYV